MTEREDFKAKIQARMLNGEPFTYGELCAENRTEDASLYRAIGGCTLIDQTIQKLRKSGKITGERKGRTFIWRATEGAN